MTYISLYMWNNSLFDRFFSIYKIIKVSPGNRKFHSKQCCIRYLSLYFNMRITIMFLEILIYNLIERYKKKVFILNMWTCITTGFRRRSLGTNCFVHMKQHEEMLSMRQLFNHYKSLYHLQKWKPVYYMLTFIDQTIIYDAVRSGIKKMIEGFRKETNSFLKRKEKLKQR